MKRNIKERLKDLRVRKYKILKRLEAQDERVAASARRLFLVRRNNESN